MDRHNRQMPMIDDDNFEDLYLVLSNSNSNVFAVVGLTTTTPTTDGYDYENATKVTNAVAVAIQPQRSSAAMRECHDVVLDDDRELLLLLQRRGMEQ